MRKEELMKQFFFHNFATVMSSSSRVSLAPEATGQSTKASFNKDILIF